MTVTLKMCVMVHSTKKEFKPGGFLSEPYNISVKLNTDGVAIFRSSQFGVWPLFLPVNELPPAMRQVEQKWSCHTDMHCLCNW